MLKAVADYDERNPPPDEAQIRRPLDILEPSLARIGLDCSGYIAKGLLERGDLGVLFGPSGCGKSFTALRLAWDIADGKPILGRKTRPSPVLYIGLEGETGVHRRVAALHTECPLAHELNFRFACLRSGDLASPEYRERLMVEITAGGFALVIVDTLARLMGANDENSAQGMAYAIHFADQIASRAGAATLFVHHSGKDAEKGARGHSSLRAAADLELSMAPGCLTLSKVKDGQSDRSFAVNLEPVWLGRDAEGDDIGTLIVSGIEEIRPSKVDKRPKPSPTEKLYLDAARQFFAEGGGEMMAPLAGMRSQFRAGTLEKIAPLLERLGVAEVPASPEEEADEGATERRRAKGQKRAANNFARLANKGHVAYADGKFWFPDEKDVS